MLRLDCPRFTKQEEAALWRKMKRGNEESYHQLILSCIPFVQKIALDYAKRFAHNEDDATGMALLHLCQVVRKNFNPKNGRLTTYVSQSLRRFLLRLNYERSTVSIPDNGCTPPNKEHHKQWLEAVYSNKHLQCDYEPDLKRDTSVEDADEIANMHAAIKKYLTDRQREVMQMFAQGMNGVEIGLILGLTRSRAQQIKESAIATLRLALVNNE